MPDLGQARGLVGGAERAVPCPPPAMGVQPPNFSWVLPGRLAGLALPRLPAHYQYLLDLGVRHLVSLTERGPPHSGGCPGLTLHRLRIPDFCPPAPEQIDRFVQIVDEANARGEVSGRSQCREGGTGRGLRGRAALGSPAGNNLAALRQRLRGGRRARRPGNPDLKPRAGEGRPKGGAQRGPRSQNQPAVSREEEGCTGLGETELDVRGR